MSTDFLHSHMEEAKIFVERHLETMTRSYSRIMGTQLIAVLLCR